jgi:regulator of replication initiation timing
MSTSTCTHHTDQQRTACPVCLVATLTAERDQLRNKLAVAKNWVQHLSRHADGLIAENVQLRAELHQLRSDCENETKWAAHYLAQSIVDKARADKAEAELATERARLDHIFNNEWPFRDRDEIDKDIKEAKK